MWKESNTAHVNEESLGNKGFQGSPVEPGVQKSVMLAQVEKMERGTERKTVPLFSGCSKTAMWSITSVVTRCV